MTVKHACICATYVCLVRMSALRMSGMQGVVYAILQGL